MGELINRLDLPTQELNNIYLSIRDRNPEPSNDGDSPAANAFTASPFGNNPSVITRLAAILRRRTG